MTAAYNMPLKGKSERKTVNWFAKQAEADADVTKGGSVTDIGNATKCFIKQTRVKDLEPIGFQRLTYSCKIPDSSQRRGEYAGP